MGRDGSHLQVTALDAENTFVRGIGFSLGEEADRVPGDLDLLYTPILNRFNGRTAVEARISALKPAD